MPDLIRPMRPSDATPAADAVRADGWGERHAFFTFAADYEQAWPFVAIDDGAVVGTGVGTANGSVGWVGTIWVRTSHRGRGLGRTLTERVIGRLEGAGCATLLLVATDLGRPLYERLGFRVQTHYQLYESPPSRVTPADVPMRPGTQIRPYAPGDLEDLLGLDRLGSGEDRAGLLRRLASSDTGRVLTADGDRVRGFLIRPPWRGGVTIAPHPDDGVALLEDRASRTAGRLRTGLPDENEAGQRRLIERGWEHTGQQVRMVRGRLPAWRPDAVWGQINYALG